MKKIIISISLLIMSFNLYAEDITGGYDGKTVITVTDSVRLAANQIIDNLLAEDGQLTALIKTLYLFFGFVMLVFLVFKYWKGEADHIDFAIFLVLLSVGGVITFKSYGGEASPYVFFAKNFSLGAYTFSSDLMEEISGGEYSDTLSFLSQLGTKLQLKVKAGGWVLSILVGFVAGLTMVFFALLLGLVNMVDSIAFLALNLTLVMGIFFVPFIFFNTGVQLALNWLKMVLGWLFTMVISKVIVVMALYAVVTYINISAGQTLLTAANANAFFWQANLLLINVENMDDVFAIMLIPLMFIPPLIMCFSWGQALAGAALPSGGFQTVGLAALLKRGLS